MAKFDEIWDSKDEFLLHRESVLRKSVNGAQRKLWEVILDRFLARLAVDDGKILAEAGNINTITALDRLFDSWNEDEHLKVVEQLGKDLLDVSSLNRSYFEIFSESESVFERTANSIRRDSLRTLGLDRKGKFVKNGFLDNFVTDQRIKTQLKQTALTAINSQQSFSDFKSALRELVVGSDERIGRLQQYYNTFAYDTYQVYDRTEGDKYAVALQMDAFIYSGGTVSDTRKFCCQRNGKIWTREEAEKWKRLKFQGKTRNYDPLRDLGGYNCRHTAQWISNKVAARRRRDLELNQKGKLRYKKGVSRQRFKQGCS